MLETVAVEPPEARATTPVAGVMSFHVLHDEPARRATVVEDTEVEAPVEEHRN